jgi:hypothetical protein|tara:strand:+ start:1400 stop:1564 length:165 start_codon:yes stop_codon:yes gene_type:complete
LVFFRGDTVETKVFGVRLREREEVSIAFEDPERVRVVLGITRGKTLVGQVKKER